MGELDKAIYDYSKVIEITSEYPVPYTNRGRLYVKTGQFDKALSDFSKAIEILPYSPSAYSYRSDVYYMMGNMVEAENDKNMIKELNSVLGLSPFLRHSHETNLLLTPGTGVQGCVNCPDGDTFWLSKDNERRLGY
jgi:tetratricopeptide (TPR) repeat protein